MPTRLSGTAPRRRCLREEFRRSRAAPGRLPSAARERRFPARGGRVRRHFFRGQGQNHRERRFLQKNLRAGTECAAQAAHKRFAFRAVELAQAAQMALHLPAADVLGQRELLHLGSGLVVVRGARQVALKKLRRQDHVADAHGGEQKLGERADIDDAPPARDALHGGNGARAVAQFAVVVVFDDDAAGAGGPVQQAPSGGSWGCTTPCRHGWKG